MSGHRPAAAALIIAFALGIPSRAAQTDRVPPPELVQYIRETRRHGVGDVKIKTQAVAVGWPAATVDEALAYTRNEKDPAAATPASRGPSTVALPKAEPEAPAAPVPSSHPPASRGVADDYLIGSGDTLQVSVWKEPEVSVPVAVVRPDGKVTVPLVKDVDVAGLTPTQAEQRITDRLKEFIADPNVTIVVATINSKKVYVVGAARKEGPIQFAYGMTVLQALSEAGGLTDYAKRKKIYVLRPDNGQQYRFDFDYDAVVKGENMEENILLLPGDSIVIPK